MLLKKYNKDEITNVKKIGVIMFGLMGDVILRTPVISALKKLYPEAKVVVLVDPIGKAVLECNDEVNEILVFDRKKEKNKLKQNLKKIKSILRVRNEKFDLLVNLYNAGLSRPMVFFSGSHYKLGFCQQKNKYLYNVVNECEEDRLKEAQSLYNYMISTVEALSDEKFSLQPRFDISNSVHQKVQNYLQSFKNYSEKTYTLNLAASKEDKILDFEKYFYIVKYLYEKYRYVPAIISNPSQEYLQERFVKEFLKESSIPYMQLKTLPLEEVAALIKETAFIVTPDTGLMHLAISLDSYILTIFTYTHPIFVDPKSKKFISLYEKFDEGCFYQHQNISEDKIKEKVDILIQRFSQ